MGTPSAVDDILNNPRFQGAIDSIGWVTNLTDAAFIMFISFVAWFIIGAALLRNVVAGAYAAFPRFFDWVAEAKEAGLQKASGSRFGPIAGFFLRLVPDFKNLSDFHDDTIEAKHYFMKAIPQAIGVVMIGVIIYNGYYRDTVSLVANFGSQMISRTLLSVDPVAVFDRLTASSGAPKFSHDTDESTKGKLVTSLSKDIYTTIISNYTDISGAAAKSALGANIEEWVVQQVDALDQNLVAEGNYSVKKQVTRVFGEPNISSVGAGDPENGTVKTVALTPVKLVDQFQFDSAKFAGEDWWLRVVLRFDKQASKAPVTGTSTSLTMNVPPSALGTKGKPITIKVPNTGGKFTAGGKITIDGKLDGKIDGGNLVIPNLMDGATSKELSVSGLFYQPSKGLSSRINKIVIHKSGIQTITFVDTNGKLENFNWGDVPVEKAK